VSLIVTSVSGISCTHNTAWERRVWVRLIPLLLAVLMLGITFQPPSASSSQSAFPGTGFGGYRWSNGPVTQVSAQWRVPRILPTSPPGDASTWIGAQNQAGPPFIQLGTVENGIDLPAPSYSAFWSDPHVDYHPQYFGSVRPGDLVSANLIRSSSGWKLTFRDVTRSTTKSETIRYGLTGTYDQSEWFQEDPSPSNVTAKDLPYPETSSVQFEHLRVNGRTPTLHLADGQVMLANGGISLAPSTVTNSSFSLEEPVGAAKDYLQAARNIDGSISAFAVDYLRWKTLPKSERQSIARSMQQAYGSFSAAIAALSLSKTSQGDALSVEDLNRKTGSDFGACALTGCPGGGESFGKIENDMRLDALSADKLRASLGLSPS
jgi:Peptidase A4 family